MEMGHEFVTKSSSEPPDKYISCNDDRRLHPFDLSSNNTCYDFLIFGLALIRGSLGLDVGIDD